MSELNRPRLRVLQIQRIQHEGHAYFLLRDHFGIGNGYVFAPLELGPVLSLLDGRHDLREIRTRVLLERGLEVEPAQLVTLFRQLDEALLLEGPRWEAAQAAALRDYQVAPARPAAFAGTIYPAEPAALAAALRAYGSGEPEPSLPAASVAGVLSPHIDFPRGGPVYAQGWAAAREAVRAAKLVIVLGTDHYGSLGSLTLTHQRYQTPYGPLGRDDELLAELAAALGEERAYAEEIHHRSEHSIELATVWLHHVRDGSPVPVLPILCGHPSRYLEHGVDSDARTSAALTVLRRAAEAGALVVVAGDLSHVGPQFGDPQPFGSRERGHVRAADEALMAACRGGATGMLRESASMQDRYRVCGLSPLAIALAIMPPVQLQACAYDQCPADAEEASFVSIAAGCFIRA